MFLQAAALPIPPQVRSGLPLWTQVVSLVIALILAGIRVVEVLQRGTLEVRLTRDSFFRLTDFGEALFVHCVLLARNGPVLIQQISITLRRFGATGSSISEKSYPMEVMNHGEKIKGPVNTAEHHFYGASPLLYVASTTTLRPVYHCLQAEYRNRQRQAVVDFQKDLIEFKRKNDEGVASGSLKPDDSARLRPEFENLLKTHRIQMLGLVELEVGDYEISLEVKYEKCGFLVWKKQAIVKSYGYFKVDSIGLEAYKGALHDTLKAHASNVLQGRNDHVTYPEFTLQTFTETPRRSLF